MKASYLFWSVFGYCLLCFLDIIYILNVHSAGLPLNDFVTHFEPLYYDHKQFHRLHHRSRRSPSKIIKLQFFAHNKHFNMKLKQDTSIFAEDVVFESNEGPVDFDISRIYVGHLEDNEETVVQGLLTSEGLFDGDIITSKSGDYYIEPASRYFSSPKDFHSIIYRAADVKMPNTNITCHSTVLYQKNCSDHLFRASVNKEFSQHLHPISPKDDHDGVVDEEEENIVGANLMNSKNNYNTNENDYDIEEIIDDFSNDKPDHDLLFAVISDSSSKESNVISALVNEHSLINVDGSSEIVEDENVIPEGSKKNFLFHRIKSNEKLSMKSLNTATSSPHDASFSANSSSDLNISIQEKNEESSRNSLPKDEAHQTLHFSLFKDIHKRDKRDSMPYDYELRYAKNSPVSVKLQIAESLQQKRAAIDPKKTTCMLYLQADHLFFQRMGSIEACIETMTRHVQKVNIIYRATDFDQDGRPDNISFMIKRIKVHTLEAMRDPNYRFPGNYGVEKFLELFSEEDYDAFCLAYMFTYRDFEGGTLGLAWTGDLKNAGGVCEKNGHYRGSLKSLNTGIVTLLNYGKHVPPAVSHVTLAHEIGHNFGSPHDPEDNRACTPGGEDGNYIMFARATSGDKRNNNKFSPCSLNNINSVLNTKARGNKGCFTEPQDSICGNEVVENGEECDCGWEEDCEEMCCFPMKANPPKHETPCKLRPNKACSPSQGPCCGPECKLQTGTKCREDNGCRDSSYCDGLSPTCPPSTNKPNKTVCNEEFVCYMGECTGSICIAYGLESCQCRRDSHDPITKTCELCCKFPGEDQQCLSSFSWNHAPYDIPDMFAKPGTPCDNYNGYCDMFQKCREVDPSGPLATLRKLLLSTESIASLKRWIVDHWWGVLFITVGFVIILIIIVKVFGKNPDLKMKMATVTGQFPGSNTAFPPAPQHAITTTVGRTNLPVTATAAGVSNGRPFGMTPNGWV